MDSYTEIGLRLRVLQWHSRENASAWYWEPEIPLDRLSPGAREEILRLAEEQIGPFKGHLKT